jgi:hypothetical protein
VLKSILVVVQKMKDFRYSTVGDWLNPTTDQRMVLVADLPDDRMRFALALHEQVEQALCIQHGVSQVEVDRWDLAFTGDGEPGDDPACPYFNEHAAATQIEWLYCELSGLDWNDYEKALEEAYNG